MGPEGSVELEELSCSWCRLSSTSMCQKSSKCAFSGEVGMAGEGGEDGGVTWDADAGTSSLSVWMR